MDVSSMLDVVHYYFEDDNSRYESGDQAEAVSRMRTQLYGLYGYQYNYKITAKKQGGQNSGFDGAPSGAVKPYVPPTEFDPDSANPFGGVLDQPLR
jgi:hypothetical protein